MPDGRRADGIMSPGPSTRKYFCRRASDRTRNFVAHYPHHETDERIKAGQEKERL
jgi:hypothetical protein